MRLSRDEAYLVLGLQDGCPEEEVRKAYKLQALKWHPDKNANSTESTERFKAINEAYARLKHPDEDDEFEMDDDMFDDDMFDDLPHEFFFFFARMMGRGGRGYGGMYSSSMYEAPCDCAQCRMRAGGARKPYRASYSYRDSFSYAPSPPPDHNRERAEMAKRAQTQEESAAMERWLATRLKLKLVSKSDYNIQAALDGISVPAGGVWEVQYRREGDASAGWTSVLPKKNGNVYVGSLRSGTLYAFRARSGKSGTYTWSGSPEYNNMWGVEVVFTTTGVAPEAAQVKSSSRAASANSAPAPAAGNTTPTASKAAPKKGQRSKGGGRAATAQAQKEPDMPAAEQEEARSQREAREAAEREKEEQRKKEKERQAAQERAAQEKLRQEEKDRERQKEKDRQAAMEHAAAEYGKVVAAQKAEAEKNKEKEREREQEKELAQQQEQQRLREKEAAKAKAKVEAKARAEAEAKQRAEAEAEAVTTVEAKARAEAEAKSRAETEAKARVEAEVSLRAEAQGRMQRDKRGRGHGMMKHPVATPVPVPEPVVTPALGSKESSGGAANNGPSRHTDPCKYFLRGQCMRGDSCWYLHDYTARSSVLDQKYVHKTKVTPIPSPTSAPAAISATIPMAVPAHPNSSFEPRTSQAGPIAAHSKGPGNGYSGSGTGGVRGAPQFGSRGATRAITVGIPPVPARQPASVIPDPISELEEKMLAKAIEESLRYQQYYQTAVHLSELDFPDLSTSVSNGARSAGDKPSCNMGSIPNKSNDNSTNSNATRDSLENRDSNADRNSRADSDSTANRDSSASQDSNPSRDSNSGGSDGISGNVNRGSYSYRGSNGYGNAHGNFGSKRGQQDGSIRGYARRDNNMFDFAGDGPQADPHHAGQEASRAGFNQACGEQSPGGKVNYREVRRPALGSNNGWITGTQRGRGADESSALQCQQGWPVPVPIPQPASQLANNQVPAPPPEEVEPAAGAPRHVDRVHADQGGADPVVSDPKGVDHKRRQPGVCHHDSQAGDQLLCQLKAKVANERKPNGRGLVAVPVPVQVPMPVLLPASAETGASAPASKGPPGAPANVTLTNSNGITNTNGNWEPAAFRQEMKGQGQEDHVGFWQGVSGFGQDTQPFDVFMPTQPAASGPASAYYPNISFYGPPMPSAVSESATGAIVSHHSSQQQAAPTTVYNTAEEEDLDLLTFGVGFAGVEDWEGGEEEEQEGGMNGGIDWGIDAGRLGARDGNAVSYGETTAMSFGSANAVPLGDGKAILFGSSKARSSGDGKARFFGIANAMSFDMFPPSLQQAKHTGRPQPLITTFSSFSPAPTTWLSSPSPTESSLLPKSSSLHGPAMPVPTPSPSAGFNPLSPKPAFYPPGSISPHHASITTIDPAAASHPHIPGAPFSQPGHPFTGIVPSSQPAAFSPAAGSATSAFSPASHSAAHLGLPSTGFPDWGATPGEGTWGPPPNAPANYVYKYPPPPPVGVNTTGTRSRFPVPAPLSIPNRGPVTNAGGIPIPARISTPNGPLTPSEAPTLTSPSARPVPNDSVPQEADSPSSNPHSLLDLLISHSQVIGKTQAMNNSQAALARSVASSSPTVSTKLSPSPAKPYNPLQAMAQSQLLRAPYLINTQQPQHLR